MVILVFGGQRALGITRGFDAKSVFGCTVLIGSGGGHGVDPSTGPDKLGDPAIPGEPGQPQRRNPSRDPVHPRINSTQRSRNQDPFQLPHRVMF